MLSNHEKIVIFGGPSLPRSFSLDRLSVRPPAVHGDFSGLIGQSSLIVVLIDGGFLHQGAITHRELARLMQSGVRVVGAASAGALRATELSRLGMKGLGVVFQALLEGIVVDDAELAVGMCSTSYKALTIPMVNLRRFLFDALRAGIPESSVEEAWRLASQIYFLSRTPAELLERWNKRLTRDLVQFYKNRPMSAWNVKEIDALAAIEYARQLSANVDLAPPSTRLDLFSNPLPA